jgi:uncharacterized protein
MPHSKYLSFLLLVLLSVVGTATGEKIQDIRPRGYVTDLAGVADPGVVQRLEMLCTEVEQKTGAQIAVVTVRSLEGSPIEEYAVDLYKHLGVGNKQENRGVLLLLAPQERKYRVEVGYGLEPVINDARAGDIGRSMVPLLRQGDYSGAIEVATGQVAQRIAADRGVTLEGKVRVAPSRGQPEPHLGAAGILLLLFLIVGLPPLLGRIFRNRPGGRGRVPWWLPPTGGGWGGSGGCGWGGGGFGGSSGGGGGFGGFGGGMSGGGGASGGW